MAPENSRQDRLLMRQRGARRQNVNNADFGIMFGSTDPKRQSATPQSARRRSSGRRSRETSIARSIRQTSILSGRSEAGDGPSSAKRRKLAAGARLDVTPAVRPGTAGQNTGKSVRRSARQSQVDIIIAEETTENPIQQAGDDGQSELAALALNEIDKENTTSETSKKKRRKRVSVGQQSRRKKRSSGRSLRDVSVNVNSQLAGMNRSVSASIERGDDEETEIEERLEDTAELAADIPQAEDEENIRVQQGSEENHELAFTIEAEDDESVEVQQEFEDDERQGANEDEQQLEDHDKPDTTIEATPSSIDHTLQFTAKSSHPSQKRKKRKAIAQTSRKRRRSSQSSRMPTPPPPVEHFTVHDNEQDKTYIEEQEEDGTPEPPTPPAAAAAVSRKGRRKGKAPARATVEDNSTQPKPKRGKKSPQPTIPITVHRLTHHSHMLDSIPEESEPDSSTESPDHLTSMPTMQRDGPNAIDVLAQVIHEQILSTTTNLSTTTTNSTIKPSERKKQLAVLASFSSAVTNHMTTLSTTLDHRLTLERRLTQSKREKASLQTRWREIRNQRESIALESDAVRAKHWDSERRDRQAHEMSERIYALETLLERDQGEEDEEIAGLGFMAKTVREHICGGPDGSAAGGILVRVREFNKLLEGVLGVLDADDDDRDRG